MGVLARLFLGRGEVPAARRPGLEAEGIVHLEEGVRGSITYRNYRAPGQRAAFRSVQLVVPLVVTRERLLVVGGQGPIVDVRWDQPEAAAVAVSVDEDRLLVAFDPAAFHPDRSGQIELRLRTVAAATVVAAIAGLRPRPSPS